MFSLVHCSYYDEFNISLTKLFGEATRILLPSSCLASWDKHFSKCSSKHLQLLHNGMCYMLIGNFYFVVNKFRWACFNSFFFERKISQGQNRSAKFVTIKFRLLILLKVLGYDFCFLWWRLWFVLHHHFYYTIIRIFYFIFGVKNVKLKCVMLEVVVLFEDLLKKWKISIYSRRKFKGMIQYSPVSNCRWVGWRWLEGNF